MSHVRIQSDVTIQVTSGLQFNDLTVKESDIKDRLKIQAMWKRCIIKQGKGIYHKEITKWPTVKALEKDGVITIGQETDEPVTSEIFELTGQSKEAVQPKTIAEPAKQPKVKVVQDLTLDEVAKE